MCLSAVDVAGVERSTDARDGDLMVTVSVSETYDISTKINKMSLIAVHSPTKTLIQKTYPGLAMNCKYWRIKGVDVRLVAVSSLPISPDQVGTDADKIAPQDMLNPILFKAVSNDSWSTLEARLAGLIGETTGNISGTMADVDDEHATGLADDFGVYYSLLSHRDGFKVAHPQQGLSMKNLKPIVFEAYYSHGENQRYDTDGDTAQGIQYDSANSVMKQVDVPAFRMRGRAHVMPRLNTTYLTGINPPSGNVQGSTYQGDGMGDGRPYNFQIQMPDVAPIMLAGIILPPAKRTIMYYRMVCRAYIEFTDIRPIQEVTSFNEMNTYSNLVYHTDYALQSAKMDTTTDMVDVKDASIEKVMEGR